LTQAVVSCGQGAALPLSDDIGQRVKVRREGEHENAGQEDQSETLDHLFLLRGTFALDAAPLTDARGVVCADQHVCSGFRKSRFECVEQESVGCARKTATFEDLAVRV
jgi:hypothetical protein